MGKHIFNKRGFTLIEIIAVLVLVGIIATIAGIPLITNGIKSFVFAKTNVATMQSGQIAITKILKELENVKAISNATSTSITYTSSSASGNQSISWAGTGNPLLFDNVILAQNISNFTMVYYSYNNSSWTPQTYSSSTYGWIIEVNLVLNGADNIHANFIGRVAPYGLE